MEKLNKVKWSNAVGAKENAFSFLQWFLQLRFVSSNTPLELCFTAHVSIRCCMRWSTPLSCCWGGGEGGRAILVRSLILRSCNPQNEEDQSSEVDLCGIRYRDSRSRNSTVSQKRCLGEIRNSRRQLNVRFCCSLLGHRDAYSLVLRVHNKVKVQGHDWLLENQTARKWESVRAVKFLIYAEIRTENYHFAKYPVMPAWKTIYLWKKNNWVNSQIENVRNSWRQPKNVFYSVCLSVTNSSNIAICARPNTSYVVCPQEP